jgi:hypothetical protein
MSITDAVDAFSQVHRRWGKSGGKVGQGALLDQLHPGRCGRSYFTIAIVGIFTRRNNSGYNQQKIWARKSVMPCYIQAWFYVVCSSRNR